MTSPSDRFSEVGTLRVTVDEGGRALREPSDDVHVTKRTAGVLACAHIRDGLMLYHRDVDRGVCGAVNRLEVDGDRSGTRRAWVNRKVHGRGLPDGDARENEGVERSQRAAVAPAAVSRGGAGFTRAARRPSSEKRPGPLSASHASRTR